MAGPVSSNSGLRERLARLKLVSKNRSGRIVGAEPCDENCDVAHENKGPSKTFSKPFREPQVPLTENAMPSATRKARPTTQTTPVPVSIVRSATKSVSRESNMKVRELDGVVVEKSFGVTTTRPKSNIKKVRTFSNVFEVDKHDSESVQDTVTALASCGETSVTDNAYEAVRNGCSSCLVGFGDGVGVSKLLTGRRSGKSSSGHNTHTEHLGVCGAILESLFGEVNDMKRDSLFSSDEILISLSVLADVIVSSASDDENKNTQKINKSKSKTYELLRDVLSEGIDDSYAQTLRGDSSIIRGGMGAGVISSSACFHGTDGSRLISLNIREDVDDGFFCEGAIDLNLPTLGVGQKTLALAFQRIQMLESDMKNKVPGAGERVHVLVQFNVLRRRWAEDIDMTETTPSTYPTTETRSKIQVVDFAGVIRDPKTNAVPEDAARNAFFRITDCLRDKRNHIPYRDSKLTRLVSNSLGGSSFLKCIFGVNDEEFSCMDATLETAHAVAKGVTNCASDGGENTVHVADEVKNTGSKAIELGKKVLNVQNVLLENLQSTNVQLEMHSSDDMLLLRDTLAKGERLRKRFERVETQKKASERVVRRFLL